MSTKKGSKFSEEHRRKLSVSFSTPTLEQSLSYKYPLIAKQALGWNPQEFFARSNTILDWICDLGHTWSASPSARVARSNCPYCSGKRVLSGFNDLATTHPKLAVQAYGWDPTVMSKGMDKRLTWKCLEYGHTWDERISKRTYYNNTGCPYCSGARVLVGFNDLATTRPDLAKEAYDWDPTTVSRGMRKKLQWKCPDYGHIWTASPGTRTCLKQDCPYCSGRTVLPGFNDLGTTHPELAKEAYNFDPTTISKGSGKLVMWQCDLCQNIWRTNPGHRTSSSSGCPSCAITGFDATKSGYLYMICQPDWGLTQIGITNFPQQRLARHRESGWKLLNLVQPISGNETRRIETELKRWFRSEGIPVGYKPDGSKFDGYTESWPEQELFISSIYELCQLARVQTTFMKSKVEIN